jgi:hypothetical protein
MILFDAHVHIHDGFDIDQVLSHAWQNFTKVRSLTPSNSLDTFFLLLCEIGRNDMFSTLHHKATATNGYYINKWHISTTSEAESLVALHENYPENPVFIIAGRQILTAERIEVLALATKNQFADNQTMHTTINCIRQQHGLAVLPWGAGKWLGTRGKQIEACIRSIELENIYLGDNGGRPTIWPTPKLFSVAARRGIKILPGSDPLFFEMELGRIGSYGGMMRGECSRAYPAHDFKELLRSQDIEIYPFGKGIKPFLFIKLQIALRLKKKTPKSL